MGDAWARVDVRTKKRGGAVGAVEYRVVYRGKDGVLSSSVFDADWRSARSYMGLLEAMGLEPVMERACFRPVSAVDSTRMEDGRRVERFRESCDLCDTLVKDDVPYVVWHPECEPDGDCLICYETHRDGVMLCADCCETLACMGVRVDSRVFAPELDVRADAWACDLLWRAVWNPDGIGVRDAKVARAWLDRTGGQEYDPAVSGLPDGCYASVDEFKRSDGPALLRRLALPEDWLDRLADAYLQSGFDGLVRRSDVSTPERLLERLNAPFDVDVACR